ncbi:MAG: hypothetical protein ACP5I2_03785 [Fervidicoccaceae archaeon]|nr:MAG: hypothetical protein C0177_02135 [Fervidicoccus fontis]
MSDDILESSDSIVFVGHSLNEVSNEELAISFSFAASIESMEVVLGVDPEGYLQPLFNEWLRRIGRFPYSKDLNYFVYEHLPEFDLNFLIENIGEVVLERLLKLPFSNDETEAQYLLEKLADFVSKLENGKREELYKVVSGLESSCGSKAKALTAVFAHLLNKSINNTFVFSL